MSIDPNTVPGCRPVNRVIETGSDHWHISYNPSVRDYGCDTTAVALGQMEYCLVLRGDHRKPLELIVGTVDTKTWKTRMHLCIDYVREHRDQLHKLSDPIF